MKVLVTGASGFVGKVLCSRLVRDGWLVKASSRSAGGHKSEPEVEWVGSGPVNGTTDWTAALDGASHVVHLAAVAHVIGETAADEREMREVNVSGSIRIAEQAAKAGVARFVHVSSIGAVCSFASRPVGESATPAPDSAYGQSKLDAETGVANALAGSRTTLTILRPSLVYGPGNPGNMKRLQRAIRKGVPLPFGSIRNKRSFVFVENLVDAIVLALTSETAVSRLFHVADTEVLSTPELIEAIARAEGCRARLFNCPLPLLWAGVAPLDLSARVLGRRGIAASYSLDRLSGSLVVDSSAIRRELGWSQRTPIEAALRRTLAAG